METPEHQYVLDRARAVLRNLPKDIRAKIPAWRSRYKRICVLPIEGRWFVFRPATLRESNTAVALSHPELHPDYIHPSKFNVKQSYRDMALYNILRRMIPSPYLILAQEYLLKRVLLSPEDYVPKPSDPAYITNHLAKVIWDRSIFTDAMAMEDLLNRTRKAVANSVDENLILFICAALKMKPSEVDDMDAVELARHVALAERLTNMDAPVSFQNNGTPGRMDPSQEQVALARYRSGINTPAARQRLGANHPEFHKPKTPLRRVKPYTGGRDVELAGLADDSSDGGYVNFQKDNKDLFDIMRDD